MDERIKDKILKVYALSQKGVDGERVAAERMLKKLLVKYGISEEELKANNKKLYYIRYQSEEESRLILQCAINFFGGSSEEYESFGWSKHTKDVALEATAADFKLFAKFVSHHRKEFKKFVRLQKKMFLQSYCQSHRLFDSDPKEMQNHRESKPLTEEEVTTLWALKDVADQTTEHISKFKQIGE